MDSSKIISTCLLVAGSFLPLVAQWIDHVPPGTPRLKNGKVNLSAPVPKAADGRPDLTGVWLHEKSTLADFKKLLGQDYEPGKQSTLIGMENEAVHKYGFNILIDLKPGEGELTPAAEAFMKQKFAERRVDNVCHGEYGWPVLGLLAEPLKIVQAPKETVILYEIDGMHRQVFVDGRKFPAEFQLPAYLGYSVGRWEKDTFVVETRGFNDRTPLDAVGHPRSEEMHVTERFHRRDYGHLETEMTFEDPIMYKKPFTVKISYELVPNNDIFEMYCGENEKDRSHMVTGK